MSLFCLLSFFFFRNIKLLREASISGRLFQFYLCVNRFIEKPLCMCNHLLFVYLVIVTQYKIHTQAHRTHLCMQHERLGRIYRKRRHDLPHVACGITDYSVDIQRFISSLPCLLMSIKRDVGISSP